ncbi:MAG: hypothetical protein SF172_10655 [Burkholderiales bacterium]|nr:hypothetical protein [Burkholderiales bacterium]
MKMRLLAVMIAALPASLTAQAPAGSGAAPSSFALWETVSRIERYGPRDREPKVERRVEKQCLGPQQRTADELLQREDMMKRLNTQCWVSEKREDAGRSQMKWACKDGTTAEIATRQPAPNRIGYQVVFNIPQQGALSITAESMKISDTCEPAQFPTPAPPQQPVPPAR